MPEDRAIPNLPPAPRDPQPAAPYSVLAAGYDVVMEHVDYDAWAEYVHGLLQHYHPGLRTLLELGCGTGSFALELQPLGGYRYTATDGSAEMIRVARAKAAMLGAPIQFAVADFTDFQVSEPVDAVILLYDGLNYLLEEDAVRALLGCACRVLRRGGLFVFDQSTPANSINNEAYFEDQGEVDAFSYTRYSNYDREKKLHITAFDLNVEGQHFYEEHLQRAYELGEVRALVRETAFEEVAAYEDLSTAPATPETERVHWVLRKP